MSDWFDYDAWAPTPADSWIGGTAPAHPHEVDPHVDLGCGTIRKGRIGIDRHPAPGVAVVMDLDALVCFSHVTRYDTDVLSADAGGLSESVGLGLPFPDNSIRSVISHHALEHIGEGFIGLVDEVYRVLEPGGILRAITPLFPSRSAVEDADHKRYFMCGDNHCTWDGFCGFPDNHWHESFSVPYAKARFKLVDRDWTPRVPVEEHWGETDVRELRVSLEAQK